MHKFISSVTIFCLITLAACSDEQPKWLKLEKQAVRDVEFLDADSTRNCLQCYALDYQSKKDCVQRLNDQYITKTEYKTEPQYQRSFQYKTEKMGFLNFLKGYNLPCAGIDHGPQFVNNANAYRIICNCENHYLLRFDYDKNEWLL